MTNHIVGDFWVLDRFEVRVVQVEEIAFCSKIFQIDPFKLLLDFLHVRDFANISDFPD